MTDKQQQIIDTWNGFEDTEPGISVERLFDMTAQACKCDIDEVCEAIEANQNPPHD